MHKLTERPGGSHSIETQPHEPSARPQIETRPGAESAKPVRMETQPRASADHLERSVFEPGRQKAMVPKDPELPKGVLSRLFSWLFGSSEKKQTISPLEAHFQSIAGEAKETSKTTNKLLVMEELAKHLTQNPLGQGRDEPLSFEGLSQDEKNRHLSMIQDQGNRYLSQLKALSPSDQFQVILELARDFRKTSGPPIADLAEKKAKLSTSTNTLLAVAGVKTTTPENVVESLKQMGAALVRSGAASPEQVGRLLDGALGKQTNSAVEAPLSSSLAEEIQKRAELLPEPSQRALNPQELKARKEALGKVYEQDRLQSLGLEQTLQQLKSGTISDAQAEQRFEAAFKSYDDVANQVADSKAASTQPKAMLAKLDTFNLIREAKGKDAQLSRDLARSLSAYNAGKMKKGDVQKQFDDALKSYMASINQYPGAARVRPEQLLALADQIQKLR